MIGSAEIAGEFLLYILSLGAGEIYGVLRPWIAWRRLWSSGESSCRYEHIMGLAVQDNPRDPVAPVTVRGA